MLRSRQFEEQNFGHNESSLHLIAKQTWVLDAMKTA